MKKWLTAFLCLLIMLCCTVTAFGAEGNVTYDGRAGEFIFEPGSEYSPTDLFPEFKDCMPGDTLIQQITVKNARRGPRVEIWLRALGAHEESEEFLSQLRLRVEQYDRRADGKELFDAPASETAQLTDWVSLGRFYPGTQTDLEVTLEIPVELDNRFSWAVGYLDWEFRVVELGSGGDPSAEPEEPVEPELPEQPEPPQEEPPVPMDPPWTGDDARFGLWLAMMLCGGAGAVFVLVLLIRRKREP